MAKELGITVGTGYNLFKPDEDITRQDMMVLAERVMRLLNQLEHTGTTREISAFKDKALVADYAINSVSTMLLEGLITGEGGKINPRANTTRAEAAMLLYRIYNQKTE